MKDKDFKYKFNDKELQTKFHFALPYSSWERGLSEYSNKLGNTFQNNHNLVTLTMNMKQVQYKIN